MTNINASALNSLQTRINAERSRRSLSPVTFTDGTHNAGDIIKATHFSELRSYTEGLNTLGSQTFNWSGNISTGANITDVLTQIDNFVTTLEGEALVGWKTLSVYTTSTANTSNGLRQSIYYSVPSAAWGVGKVRFNYHTAFGQCTRYPSPWADYGTTGFDVNMYTVKATQNGIVSDGTLDNAMWTYSTSDLSVSDWRNQNKLFNESLNTNPCLSYKGTEGGHTAKSNLYHFSCLGSYNHISNLGIHTNEVALDSTYPYVGIAKRIYTGNAMLQANLASFDVTVTDLVTVEAYY